MMLAYGVLCGLTFECRSVLFYNEGALFLTGWAVLIGVCRMTIKKIYYIPFLLIIIVMVVLVWLYMSSPSFSGQLKSGQNVIENLPANLGALALSERQKTLLSAPPLDKGVVIDKLIVYKSKREMQAYAGDVLVKTYPIALGKNPIGHKEYEGDKKTPEGIYYINDRNPNSGYHKNLGISYPNEADRAHAARLGKPAGGDIKIHGIRNGHGERIGASHLLKDWTDGCIAVTDPEIDELFVHVKHGAMIDIRP